MSEWQRIKQELLRAHAGDPWYGLPTMRILEDVTAFEAARHPVPGAHSIWELTLHMTAWAAESNRRARGGEPREPADGEWPQVPTVDEESWNRTRAALTAAVDELAATIDTLPDDLLEQLVGGETRDRAAGTGVSHYTMLLGVVQHNVYHSAQIAAMKRLLRD